MEALVQLQELAASAVVIYSSLCPVVLCMGSNTLEISADGEKGAG